jgi:hypothetical protein
MRTINTFNNYITKRFLMTARKINHMNKMAWSEGKSGPGDLSQWRRPGMLPADSSLSVVVSATPSSSPSARTCVGLLVAVVKEMLVEDRMTLRTACKEAEQEILLYMLTVVSGLKYSMKVGFWERVPQSLVRSGAGQAVVRGCKPQLGQNENKDSCQRFLASPEDHSHCLLPIPARRSLGLKWM